MLNAGTIAQKGLTAALVKIGAPAVEPLCKLLQNENSRVRKLAVGVLGRIGDPRALEPLIDTLDDEDCNVQEEVVLALGKFGKERCSTLLQEALQHSEPEIRKAAARSIGKIKDPDGIDPLLAAIQDEDPSVQEEAAKAIARIGGSGAVQSLILMVGVADGELLDRVARTLGVFGQEAFGGILEHLRTGDEASRKKLSLTMGIIGEPAIRALLDAAPEGEPLLETVEVKAILSMGEPAVTHLIAIGSSDDDLRDASVEVLARIGKPAIPILVDGLKRRKGGVHDVSGKALVMIDGDAVLPIIEALRDTGKGLLGRLMDSTEDTMVITVIQPSVERYPGFRKRALQTLVEIGEPSIAALVQAMNGKEAIVRISAAWALSGIGDPSIEPLIRLLKDGNKSAREWAAWSLARIGESAIPLLLDTLCDQDFRVREAAKSALVKRGEPAVEPLLGALKSNDPLTQDESAEALVEIGVPSVQPLIDALEDKEHPTVRRLAAKSLGDISTTALTSITSNVSKKLPPVVSGQVINVIMNIALPKLEKLIIETLKNYSGPIPKPAVDAMIKAATVSMKPAANYMIEKMMPDLYQQIMDYIMQARVPAAQPLGDLLRDNNELPEVKIEAARSLGAIRLATGIEPLSLALSDKSPEVQKAAAWALGEIQDPKALSALEEGYEKEKGEDKDKAVLEEMEKSIRGFKKK